MDLLLFLARFETFGFLLYITYEFTTGMKPEHKKLIAVFAVACTLAFTGGVV